MKKKRRQRSSRNTPNRRRLRFQSLENRRVLATLGIDIEFIDSSGSEITDAVLRGETVTVQVKVQDIRDAGQGDVAGVIALPVELSWNPLELSSTRSFDDLDPFRTTDELLTDNFPLQRLASVSGSAMPDRFGLDVRGGAIPNFPNAGQAIGIDDSERLSVIEFTALNNTTDATFQVALDGAMSFADAAVLEAVTGIDRTTNVPSRDNVVEASIAIVGGSIGGIKFNDINGDGVRDDDEPAMAGVTILLDPDAEGEPTLERQTAADGTYLFEDLAAGTYRISEIIPAGQTITVPADNEFVVTLTNENRDPSGFDFGNQAIVVPTTTVSGSKFDDLNGNGIRETGEPGKRDITVVLDRLNDDSPSMTTTTDADGNFRFENVVAGMYAVSEILPAQTIQTTPADVFTIDVNPPATVEGLEFGNFALSTIGGVKFEDLNGDGNRDTDEPPLAGVTIQLDLFDDGTIDATTVTDTDGIYQFADIVPGNHRITEIVPIGFEPTVPDINGIVFASLSGGSPNNANFGNRRIDNLASIQGVVFSDTNFDGIQDPTEFGLPEVTIQLINSSGAISETVTSARGSYQFDGLQPGSYRIVEVQPIGFADASISFGNVLPSGQVTGVTDGFNAFNGIVLAGGETAIDYNFGEVFTAVTKRMFLASANARGELASNLATTEFRIQGTIGDDVITIENLDADGIEIGINNAPPVIVTAAQASLILIDGLSGNDRINYIGSDQIETFDIAPNEFAVRTATQSIGVFGVEDIRVAGGGGQDVAVARDSDQADQLNAAGGIVALFTAAGSRIGISNVPRVQVISPIDSATDTADVDAIDFVLELAGDWQTT